MKDEVWMKWEKGLLGWGPWDCNNADITHVNNHARNNYKRIIGVFVRDDCLLLFFIFFSSLFFL